MTYEPTPFALPPFFAGVLLMALGGYALAHRRQRGALPFFFLTSAACIWCFGYALEVAAVTLDTKVLWAKVQYIGAYLTPVAWLLLAARFSGLRPFRQALRIGLVLVVPLVTIGLVFTNEAHHVIWQSTTLSENGGFQSLVVARGWWYPIGITYCYVLMALGMAFLARAAMRTNSLLREQALTLIGAALLPWFSNVVYIVSAGDAFRYDVTPLGFALACLIMAFGLFRFRMFDLVPIARDAVVDQLSDGILVVDELDRIIDANETARQLTRKSLAALTGLTIKEVFDAWPRPAESDAPGRQSRMELALVSDESRTFEVRISQLHSNLGLRIGQAIVMRDITAQKRTEEALRNANQLLGLRVSDLERRNIEISQLAHLGGQLLSVSTMGELRQAVIDSAKLLFPDDPGAPFIVPEGEEVGRPVARWGSWQRAPRATETELSAWPETMRAELSVQPANELTGPDDAADDWFHLSAPMVQNDQRLGALAIFSKDQAALAEKQPLLLAVAEEVSLAMSALRLRERLRNESIRDPLTGLFNRRYLDEVLDREIRRAERVGRPIGVIMADIDHFKPFNDTYGHAAGDAVLRALGSFLTEHSRSSDVACRYGGEEFTIVLPDSATEETMGMAQRLLDDFRNFEVTVNGQQMRGITLSIGIASYPANGHTAAELLLAADAALYAAKNLGRDRLAVSNRRRINRAS